MKRSTYIGLLVLAFAITAVGVGIIYLAFLPASATQAAVETVSYPIEILTDIVKPDSITVDFDGTPAALGVSNYPRIELGATRYTQNEQLIGKATSLLKGKTFKRWAPQHIEPRTAKWLAGIIRPLSSMRQTGANCATSHTTPAAWTMKDRGSISRMAT
ncbi:hypothetical protein [Collinsella aerofaciens]|uniref:hypothetical protein n=1 Tax=Collinsella aerofaciens TaxID=74426 RepID=UPI0034A4F66C